MAEILHEPGGVGGRGTTFPRPPIGENSPLKRTARIRLVPADRASAGSGRNGRLAVGARRHGDARAGTRGRLRARGRLRRRRHKGRQARSRKAGRVTTSGARGSHGADLETAPRTDGTRAGGLVHCRTDGHARHVADLAEEPAENLLRQRHEWAAREQQHGSAPPPQGSNGSDGRTRTYDQAGPTVRHATRVEVGPRRASVSCSVKTLLKPHVDRETLDPRCRLALGQGLPHHLG